MARRQEHVRSNERTGADGRVAPVRTLHHEGADIAEPVRGIDDTEHNRQGVEGAERDGQRDDERERPR